MVSNRRSTIAHNQDRHPDGPVTQQEARMETRTLNGFRVRCAVAADPDRKYRVQVWTRKIGANAPEKCWPTTSAGAFASEDEALQKCSLLFKGISGVRYNGEPEYSGR
jgi:hypothetical protein